MTNERQAMGKPVFETEMEALDSAEEFLDYFGIAYEPSVVQVNRLHILQRFHDYLQEVESLPREQAERHALYAGLLDSAYNDFVQSDALREKVFKVLRMREPVSVQVPPPDLPPQVSRLAPKV
jgi:nitrogenase-stabilizing/protective protein